jgi:hypothetical protein
VVCNITNPTNGLPNGSITLGISGGTPPYTVVWETGNIGPSLYNLSEGSYQATVTDYYNDFSVETTCVLTNIGPTPTPTPTPSPTPSVVEYDLCLTTDIVDRNSGLGVINFISFYPNGTTNGRPSWASIGATEIMYWDNVNNFWTVSGLTYTVISYDPIYPPTNSWNVIGIVGTANITIGTCDNIEAPITLMMLATTTTTTLSPLNADATINQPKCGCDGGITVNASGGNPPYQYSLNNGVSYSKMPFFTDLCYGLYQLVVKDSYDNMTIGSIILEKTLNPVTYLLKLDVKEKTIQNTNSVLTKEYYTTLNVTPELPSGTTLTFDIIRSHTLKSSPNQSSSTATTNSELYIDSILEPLSFSSQTSGSTFNTTAGCQNETVYIDTITEYWTGITFTYGTDLYLQTSVSTFKNENLPCYVGFSDERFTIANVEINGCDCCTVIIS